MFKEGLQDVSFSTESNFYVSILYIKYAKHCAVIHCQKCSLYLENCIYLENDRKKNLKMYHKSLIWLLNSPAHKIKHNPEHD